MSRRCTRRPHGGRRGAFSLLEAVVALVILGSVAVACLNLRAQGLHQQREIARVHAADRAAESLLAMAREGLLPDAVGPSPEDPQRRVQWRGEHLGQPYVCERTRVRVPNAAIEGADERRRTALAAEVELDQYALTYAGRTYRVLEPPLP